jgi:two-component system cell cycle response regulator
MSRAKTRRPGTRSGRRASSVVDEIPEDLADAAEAALDDLITNAGDMPYRDPAPAPAAPAPRKAPPPPPRAKSTVLELGDAQRKRTRAPDREPTLGRNSQFERDDGHAFGQPLIPNVPAAPEVDLADSLSALELEDATTEPAQVPEPERESEPESDEPRVLRFAVFEEADHLAAARSAIVAAGHSVAVNASSQSGAAKITDAIVGGKIDALLVGLPGGEAIVAAALALEPRRPIVIAAYTGKATSAIKRGIAAGADLAVVRPHDADRIAPMMLAASRLFRERSIAQTARGAELVLRAKLEEISDPEPRGLQPFETFARVLELEFKRARRFEYPLSVALFAIEISPPPPPAGIRGILRARAGNAIIHTIRDIDLATQLDHERFLVLLPYTDLTGAAGLGRRVIAAVAQGEPVISSGRAFPPRVVGAVAQAKVGEPISFAKLMKDATRALDQARRDGAELAVQP